MSSRLWSRETEIFWPDGLDSVQLARQVLAQDSSALADEITSVLQRLFPKVKRLNLALVESIRSTVSPNRALLWVQEDNVSRPVLVEIDRATIRDEIQRYDSYVRSNQSFYRFAGLGYHCILWNVGGLIYGADFASRNVQTFERVFLQVVH